MLVMRSYSARFRQDEVLWPLFSRKTIISTVRKLTRLTFFLTSINYLKPTFHVSNQSEEMRFLMPTQNRIQRNLGVTKSLSLVLTF